jgi:hypothetical protein
MRQQTRQQYKREGMIEQKDKRQRERVVQRMKWGRDRGSPPLSMA